MPSNDVTLTANATKNTTANSTKYNAEKPQVVSGELTYPSKLIPFHVEYGSTNAYGTNWNSSYDNSGALAWYKQYWTVDYDKDTGLVTYTAKSGYYLKVYHMGSGDETQYTEIWPNKSMTYYLAPTSDTRVYGWQ